MNFDNTLRILKANKKEDELRKEGERAYADEIQRRAKLIQAFKDKKLKSKKLIKEAQSYINTKKGD